MLREVKTKNMMELEEENKRLKEIIVIQKKTIDRLVERFIENKDKMNVG